MILTVVNRGKPSVIIEARGKQLSIVVDRGKPPWTVPKNRNRCNTTDVLMKRWLKDGSKIHTENLDRKNLEIPSRPLMKYWSVFQKSVQLMNRRFRSFMDRKSRLKIWTENLDRKVWKLHPGYWSNMDQFSRYRSVSPPGKLKFLRNIWMTFPIRVNNWSLLSIFASIMLWISKSESSMHWIRGHLAWDRF